MKTLKVNHMTPKCFWTFVKFLVGLVLTVILFGVVAPSYISQKDDFSVFLGASLIVLFILVVAFLAMKGASSRRDSRTSLSDDSDLFSDGGSDDC